MPPSALLRGDRALFVARLLLACADGSSAATVVPLMLGGAPLGLLIEQELGGWPTIAGSSGSAGEG